MRLENKILVLGIVLALVLLSTLGTQMARGCLDMDLCTIYDGEAVSGYLYLENVGSKNVTVVVDIYIDGNLIAGKEVALNIKCFKGFKLLTRETLEFEVSNEEGLHIITAVVLTGHTTIITSDMYEAFGEVEEEEEEEEEQEEEINVEDWLGCP